MHIHTMIPGNGWIHVLPREREREEEVCNASFANSDHIHTLTGRVDIAEKAIRSNEKLKFCGAETSLKIFIFLSSM